ncbi:cytochrome b5 [Jimgerdemannia flammicorona]|uniref:Cytochrome b5 n=1 Tax=Jimgerdemannia flammicorona TaxID=994334 RepID=A0A433D327_9FUNG|nr:cytochrome b5 [Jimgerdemannia flammicorona]
MSSGDVIGTGSPITWIMAWAQHSCRWLIDLSHRPDSAKQKTNTTPSHLELDTEKKMSTDITYQALTPQPPSAPPIELDPPKDDPIKVEELARHNGSDPNLPIYVAIKGTVFDVSRNPASYGPGAGYSVFAGKDASRALGMSSLKPEHCVADYSTLDEKELKVLDDWLTFFTKRYNIVGKVVSEDEGGR